MPENMTRGYTPTVRRMAASAGVDLTKVVGTGVGGRVTVADVRNAAGGLTPVELPAPSTTAAQPVRTVAPQNAAQMADALGPRPGGDWFPGPHPVPSIAAAQSAWDEKVYSAMTQDEFDRALATAEAAQQPGLTVDEALARLRAGSSGPAAS